MNHALETFCIDSGIPKPLELTPIRAGRNSAVYKVSSNEKDWILKHYFIHEDDLRNRLQTEYQFLKFLNMAGCKFVANPIAKNEDKQFGLYTFLDGQKPTVITKSHLDQVVDFIIYLYQLQNHPYAIKIKNAADACFDAQAHINLVKNRLNRLARIEANCPASIALVDWLNNELQPTWLSVCSKIEALEKSLTDQILILSPSDYGFHNTLENQGILSFIDFEYAGWDSAVKLICDFICQPELPISICQAEYCLSRIAKEVNQPNLINQVNILQPLHRVKWCCILLNVFLKIDYQRRIHAGADSPEILSQQLNKAKSYFNTYLQNS